MLLLLPPFLPLSPLSLNDTPSFPPSKGGVSAAITALRWGIERTRGGGRGKRRRTNTGGKEIAVSWFFWGAAAAGKKRKKKRREAKDRSVGTGDEEVEGGRGRVLAREGTHALPGLGCSLQAELERERRRLMVVVPSSSFQARFSLSLRSGKARVRFYL